MISKYILKNIRYSSYTVNIYLYCCKFTEALLTYASRK
jgi:hypothetical protein